MDKIWAKNTGNTHQTEADVWDPVRRTREMINLNYYILKSIHMIHFTLIHWPHSLRYHSSIYYRSLSPPMCLKSILVSKSSIFYTNWWPQQSSTCGLCVVSSRLLHQADWRQRCYVSTRFIRSEQLGDKGKRLQWSFHEKLLSPPL